MLAEEGADIIVLDLCGQMDTVEYPMATPEDLEETVRLVEKTGRRIVAREADVRDFTAVSSVVAEGVAELGRLDVVLANAGIMPITGEVGQTMQSFYDAVDVMLTGVFHTIEAAIPTLIEQGEGGAIVITSSTAGLKGWSPTRQPGDRGLLGTLGYIAAKHGVVGLMRAYANSLAAHRIRCNTVHPTGVNSPMVTNQAFERFFNENAEATAGLINALPVEMIDVSDISKAILFLCSDEGRYITGIQMPVDAGICNK
jgi:SDR family mycofactocin-dependent oxidoreductase